MDTRFSRWTDWHWQMSQAIRDLSGFKSWLGELGHDPQALELDSHSFDSLLASYQMGITPYYLNLIKSADRSDPVLAQVLPDSRELTVTAEELEDPIGDEAPIQGSRPLKTIVHRYPDRVLFMTTALCAVYCRFCFRKRLVGQVDENPVESELAAGIEYVRQHPEIHEVILTGGDPLVLSDDRLLDLLTRLSRIPHVQTLRMHTRFPVVNPFRLTAELGAAIAELPKPVWVATHFNHAQELSPEAAEYSSGWINRGIPFLNQTVLLKGINADTACLENLFLGLVGMKIKPYYLHHADLVKGTSHLRTSIEDGLVIMKALQGRLPGHAIPHYVLDRPGGAGKIPLQNDFND